jgi:hypothetical protein
VATTKPVATRTKSSFSLKNCTLTALPRLCIHPQASPTHTCTGWPLASCPERPRAPVLCRITNSRLPRTSRA